MVDLDEVVICEYTLRHKDLSNFEQAYYKKLKHLEKEVRLIVELVSALEELGKDSSEAKREGRLALERLKNNQRNWFINYLGLSPEYGIKELGIDFKVILKTESFFKLCRYLGEKFKNEHLYRPVIFVLYENDGELYYTNFPSEEFGKAWVRERMKYFEENSEDKEVEKTVIEHENDKPVQERATKKVRGRKCKNTATENSTRP
jgi:hypothetical protein